MLVQEFDRLLSFDMLNPIDKYRKIRSTYGWQGLTDPGELALVALYSIDTVLKQELDVTYNFYIFSDETVECMLEGTPQFDLSQQNLVQGLLLIDAAKLIYRFTCAKKFGVVDERIKQLRLNSWGRQYIEDLNLLIKYQSQVDAMVEGFREYLFRHRHVYAELIRLLLNSITSEVAAKITELNSSVRIKLLS